MSQRPDLTGHLFKWLLVIGLLPACAVSQTKSELSQKVDTYRAGHAKAILHEFSDLLSIPNVASDGVTIERNAEHVAAMLQKRGINTQLLKIEGSPPIVYGELPSPGAKRTIIFYAHYDGQPVDPSQWASPPWSPVLRDGAIEQGGKEVAMEALPQTVPGEWRLYARSAGDDKAPIEALMAALDALRELRATPTVNLKFFFEGEEEAGSPHLPSAIRQYAGLLKADAWMLCDGPVHSTRRMQLYFGARGVTDVEMTVYGPIRALHSGHYGNWAPNPAMRLVELLNSMRDENAHIKIAGFYDDVRPLTPAEEQAVREAPNVDDALRHEYGLAETEGQPEALIRRIMMPALNVRGIQSGHVGSQTQNAVPTEATASIDFRLVPNEKPERVRKLVEQHIEKQGYFIVDHAPTMDERLMHPKIIKVSWGPGYPAARTSMSAPVSLAVIKTISDALGTPVIKMPTLGGSVPMYLFTDVLKTPVIGVPIANHDDNQHSSNENLRIQNLWDGIDVFAALMANLDQNWQ